MDAINTLNIAPYREASTDGQLDGIRRHAESSDDRQLKKACEDFESILVNMMFKEMRKTVGESGLINGGFGEDVFSDMRDMELSRLAAGSGRLGLSQVLYRQLSATVKGSE
jgi:Rod binding domain-containing protein